jgi:hypothetical protein
MYMFSNLKYPVQFFTCRENLYSYVWAFFYPFMATFWCPGTPKLSTAIQKITTLIESGRDDSNLAPFSPLHCTGTRYMALARAAVESLFFKSLYGVGLGH